MNINGVDFTIGADPEIFVAEKGKTISAHGLIQGDKKNPFRVNRGAVQVDGMALEFNIDPASSKEEFKENLHTVQEQLAAMIGDRQFVNAVSTHFDEKYLKTVPLEALDLGCEPDFNAYTMDMNDRPDSSGNMRTVGGHVHIGGFMSENELETPHMSLSARLARYMDEEVGVYSILWDKDDNRRAMYGKAGAFRPKVYGMEYRTMSNAWIFHEGLISFVYDGVERALTKMFGQEEVHPEIEHIINTSDRNNEFFKNNPLVDELRSLVGV